MTARRVVIWLLALVGIGLCVVLGFIATLSRANHTSQPGLTVLVNHQSALDVIPGTPLYFEVSMTSSPSAGALTVGSRWRPWHEMIRLETSARTGMPWALSRAAPPRSLSVARTADGRPEVATNTDPSAVARLEGARQVYTVTLVASPEAMASVQPGAYRVRAVLETPRWMFWSRRGRMVSPSVIVVVRNPSALGDKREALDKQRLVRVADFYIGSGQYADAERTARQLVEIEPKQARSHILLGDALVGSRRFDDALIAYRRALVLIPPSYEEPTLLMDRIRHAIESRRR